MDLQKTRRGARAVKKQKKTRASRRVAWVSKHHCGTYIINILNIIQSQNIEGILGFGSWNGCRLLRCRSLGSRPLGNWSCCTLSGTYSLHGGSSDASRNLSLRLWEQPKTCHVFQLSLRIYTKRTTAFGRCLLVQQKAMSQSTCRRLLCFHARFRIACLAQSTTMASTHLQLHHLAHLSFYLNAVKTSKNKKNNE